MPERSVGRRAEAEAVADFLATAVAEPSALIAEGEPGIGKTTLWLDGVEQARAQGFRVLAARAASAESVLAYCPLVDLLADVDEAAWAVLPTPQRRAVDRILLRAGVDDPATDQQAVAAGFLAIVQRLADESPLLLAIDDLQWLDPSSVTVVGFVARRLPAGVGVLGTVRTGPDGGTASWLQLPAPDRVRRVRLSPMSIGGLHALVSDRLNRSLPRPAMVRVHEFSGGNPFYALELTRAMDDAAPGTEESLPSTLAELVRSRIDSVPPDVHDALLATACLAAPTVELVARATDDEPSRLVSKLADAEERGIIGIVGNRLSFAHPLLARGVYIEAAPPRRRAMHRRLAELVEQPELRARHLALAATHADAVTLQSLDAAAELARIRGAPAAAAELLELAVGLGGDTPQRRILLAGHHFAAGDPARARMMLETVIESAEAGPPLAEALRLLALVRMSDDSFFEAIGLLQRGLHCAGNDSAQRVQILLALAYTRGNVGQLDAAVADVDAAVADADELGQPHPLSQALGLRVFLRFLRGDGVDAAGMQRALELENREVRAPLPFRPGVQHALLLAFTGQLEHAREELAGIRRRCIEYGEESELIYLAFHSVLLEIWRGDFGAASLEAEDAMERARQLGGDLPLFVGLTLRAALAAYAGDVEAARADATEALAAGLRSSSTTLAEWPVMIMGFVDLSVGDHERTVTTLEPLLARLTAAPGATEIIARSFLPDVIEALVGLGRLDDADPLIAALERNGERLDRPWMLAVGARCRAVLHAAHGDLAAAISAATRAMDEHDRLPMPFERARTQLLLGQLQRRLRRKDIGAANVRGALDAFETMGVPLWADRARAELARANIGPRHTAVLTPSEQRVAELAANGMTNRDIATALFISPKTVEVNLTRIYRKLGLRSRGELSRHAESWSSA